jgi:MFS family permease
MWPNGVALASEAWSNASRPLLAGLIGAAANVGIVLVGLSGLWIANVTEDDWRWVLLVFAIPGLLGFVVLAWVPESRRWMAARRQSGPQQAALPVMEVFQPPLLKLTVIGIALGMVPVLGGWGANTYLVPWMNKAAAEAAASETSPEAAAQAKAVASRKAALVQIMHSGGGIIGSLFGGWLAALLGRRITYFLISLGTLAVCQYIYLTLNPLDAQFVWAVLTLGLVGTIYFGWLPLYLPELFPARARSTGSGVTFNFGRIGAAIAVFIAMTHKFSDYPRVGAVMSLVYAAGLIIIWFAPDTTGKTMDQ